MSEPSASEPPASPRRGWGRNHLIWLLLTSSLLPGVIAGAAPETWAALPQPVRVMTYTVSGLLITVAVGLIVTTRE